MGTPRVGPSSESKLSSHKTWLSNTIPTLRDRECATFCQSGALPSCLCIEVTCFD